jgi:hypothetical protein
MTRWHHAPVDGVSSWEIVAIHLLTGALFVFASALVFIAAWRAEPWFAFGIVPFTAFCAWGWYAELRVFREASRAMREQ